jgi:hypothetical protein
VRWHELDLAEADAARELPPIFEGADAVVHLAWGPVVNGLPSAAAGLWFTGYEEPLAAPMQSFRLQAFPVAEDVARYLEADS